MNKSISIAAVVPAAGVGARMGLNHPKQYININGKTVLEHTLDKLSNVSHIEHIFVAISETDEYFSDLDLRHIALSRVNGGKERADSVLNALKSMSDNPPKWVLVHDAARPMVDISDIEELITQCLASGEGGILASKVKDTIKRGASHSEETVPREMLWQALTPQMFLYEELLSALSVGLSKGATITDEASAMELQGKPVRLVEGRSDNIKITTPEDHALACFLMSQQKKSS
ncbi:2-C-methyl-D-erythritol 4-phosphate cytidylyltransferase [Pseudoalteromonas luteoviolacea]|uniref:2-C-methyl-D-erythritol 4-phosphate cytidylyltransferase n=1 Tax=Pseudoalteromonas luteoviolacea TaxID=43657 RepID=A0A1C0TP48_9GAMM|nr:2-C-methyl-D-erythritol 4-phosphate cytidylyltransferase [Pseudoalteromonas luteoviolacea]MBQ4813476.1 2-C-methyl-D-erythritol 4-phosphate cytidylyltransferase [Pseudoalteromonas luteoviolacea]OCQ20656.1 2-C-methyl-D-erythritol 4-phosphate cytidylyltransferase [Pseudoalteromonas luteoviolacea]